MSLSILLALMTLVLVSSLIALWVSFVRLFRLHKSSQLPSDVLLLLTAVTNT